MSFSLEDYHLTFEEEFAQGRCLDTSFWETKYWWGGRSLSSNGEQQYYADRSTRIIKNYPGLDPFSLNAAEFVDRPGTEDGYGVLTITARPSPRVGSSDGLPYLSGLITSYDGDGVGFSQMYGYFEISAQVPSGQGLWPAFWLLPADGSWPPEIDVLELLGADPGVYYFGMHWDDPATPEHDYVTKPLVAGVDLSLGFHTYGVLWEPGKLTFYLDRVEVGSMATPAQLDKPMYLLAGLAVGGNWGGAVDPSASNPAAFPESFKIDYIKVWQKGVAPLPPSTLQPTKVGSVGGDVLEGNVAASDVFAGNGGADRFVFTRGPIGNDTILDFDPAAGPDHDIVQISKSVSGARNFSDLYRMISDNAAGDAVLQLKDGSSLTFWGVSKAELSYDDFWLV